MLATGLIVLALVLLLPSLLKTRRNAVASAAKPVIKRYIRDAGDAGDAMDAVDAGRANLAILREQLAQLDAELTAGSITPTQHAQAKAEIERRALEESKGTQLTAGGTIAGQPVAALRATSTTVLVGLGIPLLALGLYGFLGNPQGFMGPKDATGTPGGEVTQAQEIGRAHV